MKTGLTIKEMAQELLRQSKAKQDYLVNTGSLSLSVTSDAPQLRVTENGLDKITPLDIRQTAHRQLGTYTRFVNEAFLSRRRKVCTGVVRIGLKKAVSGSHEYCVATFTKIADFAGEDLAHIRAYADGFVAQIKDINAQRAQAGAAASSIIGDGDASHLELPDNGAHFALGAVIDGEREELPA